MAAEPNPTLPPAPSAPPAAAPPPRAPAKSTAALVVEGLVDLGAIVAVTVLALKGRVDGTWALVLVGLLSGVRVTDLVSSIRPGSGGGGPGGGAGGLAGLVVAVATGAGHALHSLRAATRFAIAALALGACVAAAGCSGSFESRTHRGLIATAHVASIADSIAADLYAARVATLPPGAEYDRQRALFRRIKAAEIALRGLLVQAETLLDHVRAAGGNATQERCVLMRALADLATDVGTLRAALVAAGADVPASTLATEHTLAAAAAEMLPVCTGADAGADVATDGGTDA
jgi:hypothetical protein